MRRRREMASNESHQESHPWVATFACECGIKFLGLYTVDEPATNGAEEAAPKAICPVCRAEMTAEKCIEKDKEGKEAL